MSRNTPALASDKDSWLGLAPAARELGIDQRSFPKVAEAARIRVKKLPGFVGQRYFLPDIQRVAMESIEVPGKTRAVRT